MGWSLINCKQKAPVIIGTVGALSLFSYVRFTSFTHIESFNNWIKDKTNNETMQSLPPKSSNVTAVKEHQSLPMLWFTFSELRSGEAHSKALDNSKNEYLKYMRIAVASWKDNVDLNKLIPVHVFIVGYDYMLDRMITDAGGITFNASLPPSWDKKVPVGFKGCFSRVLIQEHFETAQKMLSASYNTKNLVYDTKFVFYTDADVMFHNSFDLDALPRPNILSWGAETLVGDHFANTGVMVMNIHGFTREIAEKVLHKFTQIGGACEQHAINRYLLSERGAIDVGDYINLPNRFNYKCYWGGLSVTNELPDIIHFHGPKPGRCLECIELPEDTWSKCCAEPAYLEYLPILGIGHRADNGAFCREILHEAELYLNNTYIEYPMEV